MTSELSTRDIATMLNPLQEILKHEATEKLRQRQQEEQRLQETLALQKQQREANEDWLKQSEQQMVRSCVQVASSLSSVALEDRS